LIATEQIKKEGKSHDTVGCIALDQAGNFAAATSTGGLEGAPVGRVGDSPQPGCGFYAENGRGAVAISGDGEYIARMMLAGRTMYHLEKTDPQKAVEESLEELKKVGGEAGLIAFGHDGSIGWAHNSSHFSVAFAGSEISPRIYLSKAEETGSQDKILKGAA